jgi:hypothetical protein
MKNKVDWKHIIELLGIVAIVASLIFVGFQLRQDREIAIAETFLSILSSEIDLQDTSSEHAELWEKANNGEELTDVEARIFQDLIVSFDKQANISRAQLNRLGHTLAARDRVIDFASFLYQNPGARLAWTSMWETRALHRQITGGHDSPFPGEVRMHLEMLDAADQ